MKLKNQSNKPLKGKRRQERGMFPREQVKLLQILQSTLEKKQRKQKLQK